MKQDSLWWRDGVIYQIYPRSFADSNGDGIGDLNGISSRLDYLKDLGVAALWLSPIYPSPNVDFGYDVSDYCAIHPDFGSMADFERLVAEAHARGLHIILDLVLNHTSDQHPWFQQSRQSIDNPYRDYYLWRPLKPNGAPPNNWKSVFGGPGWKVDPATGEAYFHMFYPQQPDLNWRHPAVRAEMLNIFRFWLEKGVDGFRLDVFNAYFKDADLKDNPPAFGVRAFDRIKHIHDIDQPEMLPLLAEIRALLDEKPGRYAVGETFLATPERVASYCGEDKLHAAFNFDLLRKPWSARAFLTSIQQWEGVLDPESFPNYVLNNHDTRRSASRFGRGEDDRRLKAAAAILMTLRGTPFIYYGEEIGMRDVPVSRKEIQDPLGLTFWPIPVGRDGCRSPMQWDASEFGGFSKATPWLKVHQNHIQRNVAAQSEDPNSILNFYRRLMAIRKEHPVLRTGMFQPITYEPINILGYLRQDEEETILVAVNFGRRRRRLVLGTTLRNAQWELLLSSQRSTLPAIKDGLLPLEGEEVVILQKGK